MENMEHREQKFLLELINKLEAITKELQEMREKSLQRCQIWKRPLTEK